MFSVLYGVERPLHGNKPFGYAASEEKPRSFQTVLFYERESSRSVFAVDIRQFSVIQQFVARNGDEPARGELFGRSFVFFDDYRGVFNRRFSPRAAFFGADGQIINVHVRAFDVNAVLFAYFAHGHGSRVNYAETIPYFFVVHAVGENLERRHGNNLNVPFVHRFPVRYSHRVAAAVIPHDFVKARAARFAPYRRFFNRSVKVVSLERGIEKFLRERRAVHV